MTITSLPRASVEAFLHRQRADYRKANKWSLKEIELRKQMLPVAPPIWDKLTRPQKICVLIGANKRRFIFLNDMGGGKTLIALALIAYFHAAERAQAFLVLVPKRVNKDEWTREIAKHCPELSFTLLPSNIEGKRVVLAKPPSLILVDTYAGFTWACSEKEVVPVKRGSKKTKVVLKPNATLLTKLSKNLSGVIADESSFLGTHDSLQTRLCRAIARRDPERCMFLLTGTPFGRDPQPMWSQMQIVDDGHSLGETLGLFRATFYTTEADYWGHLQHKFRVRMEPSLHRFIAHRSIRWPLDQSELPEMMPVKAMITLDKDANVYVERAWKLLREAKGDRRLCKNSFIRMRQISSGFIGVTDDETGEKASMVFKDNPKLDYAIGKCEAASDKVIVFHEFIHSGKVLAAALKRAGIGHVSINGATKDTTGTYAMFRDDPDTKVLVLNNSSGSFGLNLQVARYAIFYESPVSVIVRKQAMRRIVRPHSEHSHVVIYDCVVKGTVDEDILKFHKTGEDLFQAVMNGKLKGQQHREERAGRQQAFIEKVWADPMV